MTDTRREDVARDLIEAHVAEFEASIARLEASIQDPNTTTGGREYDTAKLHGQRGAVYALRRLAGVLAVLPAPPVVDEGIAAVLRAGTEIQAQTEAEVRERIAQDIARAVGEGTASDIARGATR